MDFFQLSKHWVSFLHRTTSSPGRFPFKLWTFHPACVSDIFMLCLGIECSYFLKPKIFTQTEGFLNRWGDAGASPHAWLLLAHRVQIRSGSAEVSAVTLQQNCLLGTSMRWPSALLPPWQRALSKELIPRVSSGWHLLSIRQLSSPTASFPSTRCPFHCSSAPCKAQIALLGPHFQGSLHLGGLCMYIL